LNVGKVLILAKQTQVQAKKARVARSRVTQKLHEETWNAASNLCCQFVQALCGRPNIVFENCRCSWNRS